MRLYFLSALLLLYCCTFHAQDTGCYPDAEFTVEHSGESQCCYWFQDVLPTDDLIDCREWTVDGILIQTGTTYAGYCFTQPGDHVVCYTDCCVDGDGNTQTAQTCQEIHVEEICGCCLPYDFEMAPTESCWFTHFTALYPSECEGVNNTYEWDFGDGHTSNDDNPVHDYAANGWYTICLTVTCPTGDKVDFCHEFEVNCCVIEGGLNITQDGCIWTLTLEATSSNFPDLCGWMEGGGTDLPIDQISTVVDLTDHCGRWGVCYGIYECGNPANGCVGECIDFNVRCCCSPDLDITAESTGNCCMHFVASNMESDLCAEWDFGDGTTASGLIETDHCFEGEGPYFVTFTTCCEGEDGELHYHTTYEEVSPNCNCCPVAMMNVTLDEETCTVNASALMECPPSPAPLLTWQWGDGQTSTGANASHQYAECGAYSVTLTATCNGAITYQSSMDVEVNCNCCSVPDPLDVTLGVNDAECMAGYCVNNIPSDPHHIYCSTVWWGDGTVEDLPLDICPAHFYNCSGTYEFILHVYCCEDPENYVEYTETFTLHCENSCCSAEFSADCAYYYCYSFTDLTPHDTPSDCETWTVDGNTVLLTGDDMLYCFQTPGPHEVCHTDCCMDEAGNVTYETHCETIVVEDCGLCYDPSQIDNTLNCIQLYDPVCGCDGQTYYNECEAYYHGGITYWTQGECSTDCCFPIDFIHECSTDGTINFMPIFSGPCDDVGYDYFWDYGDGTSQTTWGYGAHTYDDTAPPTITVCLTVTCTDGTTFMLCDEVETHCPCSADLWPSIQQDGCTWTVTFANHGTTPLNEICVAVEGLPTMSADEYVSVWNFQGCTFWGICYEYWCCNDPDGPHSAPCVDYIVDCCCPDPEFTYEVMGCCVTLEATEPEGCISAVEDLHVDMNGDHVITIDDLEIYQQQCCYFELSDGTILYGPGPHEYCTYDWDFLEVTYHSCCQKPWDVITHQEVTHYIEMGECCNAVANFNRPLQPIDPCMAVFGNLSTWSGGTGATVSYLWDFGDGTTSTLINTSHLFTGPGPWHVCLTVTVYDNAGNICAIDTHCEDVIMSNCDSHCPMESYDFVWAVWDNCNTRVFDILPVGDVDIDDVCGYWDYGDGNQAPYDGDFHSGYTWAAPGIYTVCLYLWCCDDGTEPVVIPVCHEVEVGCDCCGAEADFTWTKGDDCTFDFAGSIPHYLTGCWSWDFGDGTTDQGHNTQHQYTASGDYEVCLTTCCLSSEGNASYFTTCHTVHANCDCDVQPGFHSVLHDNCLSLSNIFENLGTTPLDQICVHWDFGDGSTADLTGPNLNGHHTYSALGFYTVCVTAWCCNDPTTSVTECHEVQVGCPCDGMPADFTWTDSGCTVDFHGFDVYNPGGFSGPSNCWTWDFGDGTDPISHFYAAMADDITHTYAESGTYTVCLTTCCLDPATGETVYGTTCHDVTVECVCTCCMPSAMDYYTIQGCTIVLDALWEVDCAQHPAVFWDLGDGHPYIYGEHLNHTFDASGLYTICLKAQCGDGDPVTIACETVDIDCCFRPFTFGHSQDGCMACFSAVYEGPRPSQCVTWDFGDGETGSGPYVCHNYNQSGTYYVCMTGCCCEDLEGSCYTRCEWITVNCPCDKPCGVSARWVYDQLDEKCKFQFTDQSVPADGSTITGWTWTLDGTFMTNAQHPAFSIGSGTHEVCLFVTATNDAGQTCEDRFCWNVTCCETSPTGCGGVVDFSMLNLSNCNIQFTDLSVPNGVSSFASWYWDFGDGSASTLQNPVHHYSSPGSYTIKLIVTFVHDGKKCEFSKNITIEINCEPTCEIRSEWNYEFNPEHCMFYGYGNASYGGPCTVNYLWEFGDGTTSTAQNPAHHYAHGGSYTVCLTTWVNCQDFHCSDRKCQRISFECACACEGTPLFTVTPVGDCLFKFTYLNNLDPCLEVREIKWTFGDGHDGSGNNILHAYGGSGFYNICVHVYVNNGNQDCELVHCETRHINCNASMPMAPGDEGLIKPEKSVLDFSINPNPNQGHFTLMFNRSISSGDLTLRDKMGKVVATRIIQGETRMLEWTVPNLECGVYSLEYRAGIDRVVKRTVICE